MKTLRQTSPDNSHLYDISLDAAGDFVFSEGLEAYGNIIADAIRTLKGELQLDVERGIPYDETVWDSVTKVWRWKALVSAAVRAYGFVYDVSRFDVEVDPPRRQLSYQMRVVTDAGTVEVSG